MAIKTHRMFIRLHPKIGSAKGREWDCQRKIIHIDQIILLSFEAMHHISANLMNLIGNLPILAIEKPE